MDPHRSSNNPRSVSPTQQGLSALLSLCPPNPAPRVLSQGHSLWWSSSSAPAVRECHSMDFPRGWGCSLGNGGGFLLGMGCLWGMGEDFLRGWKSSQWNGGGFPPWMGVSPVEWESITPALAESEGTSPAQPRAGDRARWDRGVPLQAHKHSSQECSPGRQTAPVFLQEPCSPLQLAFLEIPLLAATKPLLSLFPCTAAGAGIALSRSAFL